MVPFLPLRHRHRRVSAYTSLEILAIVLVLGVLSAVVVGRAVGSGPSLEVESAELKANLRFVQAQAMADSGSSWSVVFGADRYSLYRDGALASADWPGGGSAIRVLEGVVVQAAPASLVFSALGSAGDADQTITLADGKGRTAVVTIVGGTGFVR